MVVMEPQCLLDFLFFYFDVVKNVSKLPFDLYVNEQLWCMGPSCPYLNADSVQACDGKLPVNEPNPCFKM